MGVRLPRRDGLRAGPSATTRPTWATTPGSPAIPAARRTRWGKKKPNPWGLYDMHGDVPEWCWDRYASELLQARSVERPGGRRPSGDVRVYRGGGWNDDAGQTRSASRQGLGVAYGGVLNHVGFRVARNAAP